MSVRSTLQLPSHYLCTTNAGVSMPRFIYGTAWKKERTAELVQQAILAGFRGVDTACQPKHYFEPGVGQALTTLAKEHNISRDQLFLQTKFTSLDGQDPQNIPYQKGAPLPDQVRESLAVSLRNLGTTYLDSLVLHSPMPRLTDTHTVWGVFEEFVDAGTVRQLGISNCYDLKTLKSLYDQARVKPAVLQNRFYRESGFDKDIRNFCQSVGIVYQSFWTLTANPHILRSTVVKTLAEKLAKSPEQVWFRFCMEEGIAPLTGTTQAQHMKQDLEVLDMSLQPEEVESIRKLLK